MSLDAALSLQVMQYASPKAIWNLLFGASSPPFGQDKGLKFTRMPHVALYCK